MRRGKRTSAQAQLADVGLLVQRELGDTSCGMGRKVRRAVIDLGDLAIHHVAAAGSGDHGGGGGEILLLGAAGINVGFVHRDHVQFEAAEVQRAHVDNAVIAAQFLIDRADDDAAIAVKQLLHLVHIENRVGHVRADNEIGSTQAALGELAAHCFDIAEEIAAGRIPLRRNRVGVVAGRIIELHMQLLALGLIVDVGLHGAGIVDHGLCAHPFLPAYDAALHVGQVIQLQPGRALGGGAVGVDRLTEAALAQLVQRQQTGGHDECGLILMDFIAAALHGNVPGTSRDKRRHLAVSLAVLGQHLVGRKDVTCTGGEITVLEERLLRNDFFHDRHQHIGVKKIQFAHSWYPSLVGSGGSFEHNAAHTQIVLVAVRDAVAGGDAHLVRVEAASGINRGIFVGSGADFHIVTQDAVRGKRLVAYCGGAKRHQFAVSASPGGLCEDRTALERCSSGQLTDRTAAHLGCGLDVGEQAVKVHLTEFLAQIGHGLTLLLLAEQLGNVGSCSCHACFRRLARLVSLFKLRRTRSRTDVFCAGILTVARKVSKEFLTLLRGCFCSGHQQISSSAGLVSVLGLLHIGGIEQPGNLVDFLHACAFCLDCGIDRVGMVDGSTGSGLRLGDFVRVLRPELFQSHGISSFVAGSIRRICMCLNRGGGLGCDRGNRVRGKHPRRKVNLLTTHK
nr:MAG TPA: hypothetical protein [Caudoviricetes sp.]